MTKIRFLLSLWAGKLVLWYFKKKGRIKDDKPGMRSLRIFFDFVRYVAKPKIVIAVTGTNGKTSITRVIADMFTAAGYKVAYNSWGANDNAGYARLFLDAVTVFNKTTRDVAVVEMDEISIARMLEMVQPQYLIVNNLAQDSFHRNGNVDYVASRINRGCDRYSKTTLIVNGDDPVCIGIGSDNKKVYFGVCNQGTLNEKYITNDFPICPKCGSKPVYKYRTYRHLGEFYCPTCGYKSPERDYFVKEIRESSFVVREKAGEYEYPTLSKSLFNIYNVTGVVSLFRQLGYEPEKISELLKQAKLPENRDRRETYEGVEIWDQASKGQNPSAISTNMEYISKQPGNKAIILALDELLPQDHKIETTTYIYSTDYEFLNNDSIKQIVIVGYRYKEHKVRCLLAGIKPEIISCCETVYEADDLIKAEGIDRFVIMHDIYFTAQLRDHLIDAIKKKIRERGE